MAEKVKEVVKEKIKFIPMYKVVSSNVEAVGFDEKEETIYVEFKQGHTIYAYPKTTKQEFKTLTEAESVGRAFHAFKAGKEYKKVR